MTTLVERRFDTTFVAAFLVVVAAVVAWRAWAATPVASVIAIAFAVAVIAFWVWWRRRPPSQIVVGPDAVTWGTPTKVVTRIERGPTGTLRFSRNAVQQTPWYLHSVDDPGGGGISMHGFDLGEVRQACEAHGWHVE